MLQAPLPRSQSLEQAVTRGTLVNALGLMGRVLDPVFILIATWLYGPAVFGVYLLSLAVVEMVLAFGTAGLADATTIYASHDADGAASNDEAAQRLYRTLATNMTLAVGFCIALAAVGFVTAPTVVALLFPTQPDVILGLRLAALSLPLQAVTRIGLAATKAQLQMKFDVVVSSFLRPIALATFAALARWWRPDLSALLAAYLATHLVLAAATIWIFRSRFSLGALTKGLRRGLDFRQVTFALPQSLNMTFAQYLARIDLIMLAAFGVPATALGFYGTAALLVGQLRQIRLVFSTALAPVAARHHHRGASDDLERTLGLVARWTSTLVVPVLLAVVVLRNDVLAFVHESYTGDTSFVLILLIPALVTCTIGLAGNCLVYTGRSGWNLANSLSTAGLNTVLNMILIPRFGFVGAAGATALAATSIALLQVIELDRLEGIRIRWPYVASPVAGLGAGMGVLLLAWDPAIRGSLGTRVVWLTAALAVALGTMFVTGHLELRMLLTRWGLLRRRVRAGR